MRRELMARYGAGLVGGSGGPLYVGRQIGKEPFPVHIVERVTEDSVIISDGYPPIALDAFAAEGFDGATGWTCTAQHRYDGVWALRERSVSYRVQRSGSATFISGMTINEHGVGMDHYVDTIRF